MNAQIGFVLSSNIDKYFQGISFGVDPFKLFIYLVLRPWKHEKAWLRWHDVIFHLKVSKLNTLPTAEFKKTLAEKKTLPKSIDLLWLGWISAVTCVSSSGDMCDQT